MGCTGGKTYEEAVRDELKRYLHNFKLTSTQEKEIRNFINQDLTKKALALKNYQYIYRDEDAQQTAEDYKRIIMERFHVGLSMYDQSAKIAETNNQANQNNNNENININNNKKNNDNKNNDNKNNDNKNNVNNKQDESNNKNNENSNPNNKNGDNSNKNDKKDNETTDNKNKNINNTQN